jgi:hypothetical protein
MIEIKIGDCTQRLKDLEDNSVDAIICDPPYGLKFMSKGWDNIGDGSQQREWHRKWLTEAHRILKPNGVIKSFSGSRTFHHLIAMMEEIGFSELRVEAWAYGSGFPKSLNVSKGIDKRFGAERIVVGTQKMGGSARKIKGSNRNGQKMVGVDLEYEETYAEITTPSTDQAKQWDGWGTALKPAFEPVCIGVKK